MQISSLFQTIIGLFQATLDNVRLHVIGLDEALRRKSSCTT